MAETVFILGAGASAEAGVPVMKDFLDRAEDLATNASIPEFKESWQQVNEARRELQAVQSKARLELDNIEQLFATFEMAEVVGRLGSMDRESIHRLATAMRILIIRTVEHTLLFQPSDRKLAPPDGYVAFARLMLSLREKGRDPAILTFNYDIGIDHALNFVGARVEHFLWGTTQSDKIHLLKLHGSTHWGWCSKCNETVPWELEEFFKQFSESEVLARGTGKLFVPISEQLTQLKHTGHPVDPHPMIVPPTWRKSSHHKALRPVWEQAARELAEAKNIYVIGYSLPPSDHFFPYLYALGTLGETRLRRFHVINPDRSVKPRFEDLLGPDARGRIQFTEARFRNSSDIIRKDLAP